MSDDDPTPPAPTDPWSVWFPRLVQTSGLGVIGYETVVENNDRPYLLFLAGGMMLGTLGMQLVLKWLAAKVA